MHLVALLLGCISIHAPVKGATYGGAFLEDCREISIHAPVKGATGHHQYTHARCNHFNPRSREGSDQHDAILAPYTGNFNPRSREGSDG